VLDLFNGVKGIAWLQFRNNDDSVLDVLRYCPEIRYLEVNGGSYQWSALQSLESNNELRRVAFSAVKLTSDQLAPIATARALETIGFRGMRAEPGFMDTLVTQTHSLRRISFNAAGGLDREAFAKFARFKLVENLNLWASGVSDEDVDAIGGMESLKSAQLGYNRGITGRTLNELANLKALKSLSLWSTSVTDEGLVNLPPLPSLRKLALAGGGLTPQGIRHLEKYQTLRSVELSKSEALDDEVFTTLRKLPLLNHVETVDTNITKEGMAEFARDRPGFTSNILTRKDE